MRWNYGKGKSVQISDDYEDSKDRELLSKYVGQKLTIGSTKMPNRYSIEHYKVYDENMEVILNQNKTDIFPFIDADLKLWKKGSDK